MKRFSTFFVAICATLSTFAVENVTITNTSDIRKWVDVGTDLYWTIGATVDGVAWQLTLDPTMDAPEYPWGTILTEADMDWGYTELKRNSSKPVGSVTNLKFCAKLDGESTQMYEMVYDATYGAIDYHVHVLHNVPDGTSLFGDDPSNPPSEEDGEENVGDYDITFTLASNPTITNFPNDIYYQFTCEDCGWTIEVDPIGKAITYGKTYTHSEMDDSGCSAKGVGDYSGNWRMSEVNFTVVKVNGEDAYKIEAVLYKMWGDDRTPKLLAVSSNWSDTADSDGDGNEEEEEEEDSPSAEGSGTAGDPYEITPETACPGGENGGKYFSAISIYYKYTATAVGRLTYETETSGSVIVYMFYNTSSCMDLANMQQSRNFDDGIDIVNGTTYYFRLSIQGTVNSVTFHFEPQSGNNENENENQEPEGGEIQLTLEQNPEITRYDGRTLYWFTCGGTGWTINVQISEDYINSGDTYTIANIEDWGSAVYGYGDYDGAWKFSAINFTYKQINGHDAYMIEATLYKSSGDTRTPTLLAVSENWDEEEIQGGPEPTPDSPELLSATNNGNPAGSTVETFSNTIILTFSAPVKFFGYHLNYSFNYDVVGDGNVTMSDDGYSATVTIEGADEYLTQNGEHKLSIRNTNFELIENDEVHLAENIDLIWTRQGAETHVVNFTSDGFATFCWDKNWIVPEGAFAYKALDVSDGEIAITKARKSRIKAGEGVMLYSEELAGQSIEVYSTIAAAEALEDNIFSGTTEQIANPGNSASTTTPVYVLAYKNNETALYQYIGSWIPGNKAYIQLNAAAPAPRLRVRFAEEVTTSTETVENNHSIKKQLINGQLYIIREGKRYDLQGRECNND